MPKQANPHFDGVALLQHVQQQDYGLQVSTNDPSGFRRILYGVMRAAEHLRCHIYQHPASKRRFVLLKAALPNVAPVEETTEEPADEQ